VSAAASYLPVKLLKEDLHNYISMSLPSCVFIVKSNPLSSWQETGFRTDVKQSLPDKSENMEFLNSYRVRQLPVNSNSFRNYWLSLFYGRKGSELLGANAPWSPGGFVLFQACKLFLCGCEGSL